MAAPVAGEANLPAMETSDVPLINNDDRRPFDSAEDDFTISQLAKSISSPPQPPPPDSITSSLGKRRKSKPVRYGVFVPVEEKKHSPQNVCTVAHDHSSKCLSSPKENSATKCMTSPVEKSAAMIRAKEIQSSLGTEYPSCIKLMLRGHVGSGYWMGFSQPFSKLYLPKTDIDMEVEDENGDIHHIRYIADKSGLSAGWKKFADGHNLLEGDVLVFHLIQPCKFKVYIIRANDLNKVDGTLRLLSSEAHAEQMTPEIHKKTDTPSSITEKSKLPKSLSIRVQKKRKKLTTPSRISRNRIDQPKNVGEEVGSEALEDSRPSNADISYQKFKSFEDFHIMVKGICIDSELPDDVRMNYYKLCISRKEFLHDSLPETLYHKLVAGMIGQTVNIANEIKKCILTTPKEDFEVWDNSLKSFELLGLKVGFLRDRIHTLVRLVFESEGCLDIQRYTEVKNEHKSIEEEIKHTKEKLVELNKSCRKIQGILDGLKKKAGRHEVKFQEEVDAPW